MKRLIAGVIVCCCASLGLGQSIWASVTIHGFSGMTYGFTQEESKNHNEFMMGGLVLAFSARLGEKTTFFNETVFEVSPENENILDVERTWIKYSVNDMFNIKVGRVHTALGFWNSQYHHGSWFQASISRPVVYDFEDDAGILPVHGMGIEFSGIIASSLGYIFSIANGRGATVDPPQVGSDANKAKSFSVNVYYRLPIEGLRLGGLYYLDSIPDYKAESTVQRGAAENIMGAHLIYLADGFEFISEYHQVVHVYRDTAKTKTNITSLFAQASYTLEEVWTPYYRYELQKGDSKHNDVYLRDVEKNKSPRLNCNAVDPV